MRIVAYCLMSNHWHLVLWPQHDGDLGAFMQKLTITHALGTGKSIATAWATGNRTRGATNRFL